MKATQTPKGVRAMRATPKANHVGNARTQMHNVCASIEAYELRKLHMDVRKAKRPTTDTLKGELSKLSIPALIELEAVLSKADTYLILAKEA